MIDPYKHLRKEKELPFKAGDDKPDLVDEKGKAWLAKKDESKEDLAKRAKDDRKKEVQETADKGGEVGDQIP